MAGAPLPVARPQSAERSGTSRLGERIEAHVASRVAVLAFACLLPVAEAAADDAPPPPPSHPIEEVFAPLKASMADLPPFFRDTDLKLHFRSYDFDRENPENGSRNEAWAFGGWAAYRSGWLLDTFGVGVTFYGSAPLYAPVDRDGTGLLKPGQEGYYVVGEAYAVLRYKDFVQVKGYRQMVNQPYINSIDNRMSPNTFEGVTAAGKVGVVTYQSGYLWKIKPRNADEFVPMSRQAGAPGTDDGVVFAAIHATPSPRLRIDAAEEYGINTFNTLYMEGEYQVPLDQGWKLRLGAQFTDQRAVGDELLTNAATRSWNTQQGGVRVQAVRRDLTLTTAFSITSSGNNIQEPWGYSPNYLLMMDRDFNRADEKAALVGAIYDFSRVVTQGLTGTASAAAGWGAVNPKTLASAPDQREYNLTFDYRPPLRRPTFLEGWWLRLRGGIIDQTGAPHLGWQIRLILNWDRDLL